MARVDTSALAIMPFIERLKGNARASVSRAPARLLAGLRIGLVYQRSLLMSDAKERVKDGVDKAASKTKEVAGKAVDKSKGFVKDAGNKIKQAGQKVKEQAD